MKLEAVMRDIPAATLVILGVLSCGGDDAAATADVSGGATSGGPTSTTAPMSTSEGPTTVDTSSASSDDDAAGTTTGEPVPEPEPIDCDVVPCRYVHADAAAGGDGSSWSTAFTALPDAPERGTVYLFADGSYAGLVLDAPEADDAWITLVKATPGDHGTDDGWDDAMGDGQAELDDIVMVSDRWIVDGRVRNESDWTDVDAYGFRVPGGVTGHTINFGRASNDAVFRHLDLGGPPTGVFDESIPSAGFYFGGFDQVIERWTITSCHVHDVYLPFQLAGADDIVIETSWLGPNWSKETIRGQGHAARIVIRHNVLKDGCQGTPGDPTATGCTGQIAIWDGDTPGDFDGVEIYGNVIWTTVGTAHSDACILVGGDDGVSAAGVSANDVLVYGNTLVGVAAGRCSIRCPGVHEGDEVVDNLWWGLGDGVATDCEADRCESNAVVDDDPFVDAAGGDFHLAIPTSAGTSLPAPYDVDRDGTVRGADGVWDLGAFEH